MKIQKTEEQLKEEMRICAGLIKASQQAMQPTAKLKGQFYRLSVEYKKFWLKKQVQVPAPVEVKSEKIILFEKVLARFDHAFVELHDKKAYLPVLAVGEINELFSFIVEELEKIKKGGENNNG